MTSRARQSGGLSRRKQSFALPLSPVAPFAAPLKRARRKVFLSLGIVWFHREFSARIASAQKLFSFVTV